VLMATSAFGQGSPEPSGLPTRIDADPVEGEIIDKRRSVYHVVKPGYIVTSYDNGVGLLGVDVPYTEAIKRDDPSDLRVIVFENTDLIDELSGRTSRQLSRQLDGSETIVCAEGLGRDIKLALDRLDPALADAGSTTGGEGVLVCIFESPAGYTAELSVAAPGDGDEALFATFRRIRDWYDRNLDDPDRSSPALDGTEQGAAGLLAPDYWWERLFGVRPALAQTSSPWDAIHAFEWSGETDGSFLGSEQTAGTYKFTLTVFSLASDDLGFDWYRLNFQTISEITNYEFVGDKFGDTEGKCGWWTEEVGASITLTTSGGQWWDYMPSTTVNSTTTGFTIGGDISTSESGASAGVSAAYSESYGTSDVEITVSANSVTQSIDWVASLRGCDNYEWYPDYRDASSAAKTTYDLSPALIAAVPSGSTLTFRTSGTNDWGLTVRKDDIKCGFACATTNTKKDTHSTTLNVSHSCTSDSCT